jgi:AcrR family transcriptional regulator
MPRNKEANQRVRDERREQIMSAALNLFAVKGLAATRISDISKASGISQGLIYHYFSSKEDLFTRLIGEAMERMNGAALELENMTASAREKIIFATDALLKGFEEKSSSVQYFYLITQTALTESFPEGAREVVRLRNHIKFDVMRRIFGEGQKEGTVRKSDPGQMATLFFSSLNGLALNKAINGEEFVMPDKKIFLGMFLTDIVNI